MSPEQLPEVRRLFEEALEIEPERRAAWVAEHATGALRSEVDGLLRGHDIGTDFLNRVQRSLTPPPAPGLTGRRVGSYELLEFVAHGGMGAVYRAARADDAFRKTVAVKLLGFQSAGPELEFAFRLERQILASLEHPNIARLIDGGATPEGLLYIVMEFVEGAPIDRYCEQEALPLNRRLELFEGVCSAVEHAHRNLIVHRDIKPSNILVTAGGDVKLLDFGIAKILGEAAPGAQANTAPTMAGMTPLYASPEQIQQRPITTATDVYSLGVVLYGLLTGGVHPYQNAAADLGGTIKAICERDPPWPSVAAKTSFGRRLRGDLDNIVLKAMAKDPAARYSTVGQFAEDIRRHRHGLPVAAQGDAFTYRAFKFARRNIAAVSIAAALCLLLCGGIVSTVYQAGVAQRQRLLAERRAIEAEQARSETDRQRDRAETERARAEARTEEANRMRAVADRRRLDARGLATTILFGIYDNIRNLAGSAQARKLALEKSLQYLEALSRESEGDPSLEAELAAGYERAGELMGSLFDRNTEGGAAAVPILQKALALRRRVADASPGDPAAVLALALSYYGYGNAQFSAGRTDGAIENLERGLTVARAAANSPEYPQVKATLQARLCGLSNLGSDAAATLSLCRQTVSDLRQLAERRPGDRDLIFNLAATEGQLGNALRVQARPDEAVPLLRLASSRLRALLQADPNDHRPRQALAAIRPYLTAALVALRDATAPADWAEAIAAIDSTLTSDPADYRTLMVLGYALQKYSAVLRDHGRELEAETAYERALTIYRDAAAKPKAGAMEWNDFSAALSKCPFPRLQDFSLALELGARANQTTGGKNPVILDTLAWAYFRNGEVSKAIETVRFALALLPAAGTGRETGLRKEIADSLAEFEKAR